jgi:urea transport system permease protein
MYSAQSILTQLLNGPSLTMILILIAMGLGIIYGLMGVINLAHGEIFAIGAFVVAVVIPIGGFWVGVIVAPIVGALAGALLERGCIRFLYQRPLDTILATWGISLVLQQVLRLIFGSLPQDIGATPFSGTVQILGFSYPAYRVFLIGAGLLISVLVAVLFMRTHFGLQVRAVIQNREMAAALGVDTSGVYLRAFALGSALAALSGALVAPLINVFPYMGVAYLARAFFVIVVGGTGGLTGVFAGAGFMGLSETFLSFFTSLVLAQALVLVAAVVVARFRPNGLFYRG